MTFTELGTRLNELKIGNTALKFAHFGWSSAPAGDYGVYGEDGADQFQASNRYAESLMRGTVDWFTRTDDGVAKDLIEDLFRTIQDEAPFAWYLSSIQYENDTHFLHYTWAVEVA